MDIFAEIREMQGVKKVSYLYEHVGQGVITFIFFLCPKMKGNGLKLNRNRTGLTVKYGEGWTGATEERFVLVQDFLRQFKALNLDFQVRAIMAAGDAHILFPEPVDPPKFSENSFGFEVVSNLPAVLQNMDFFWQMYRERPWLNGKKWAAIFESKRLFEMLSGFPEGLVNDFIERVFAGFALDGVLIRRGEFGNNPVLLGVESAGVAALQNVALKRENWLPIIQLV